jgi:hypothetical protein
VAVSCGCAALVAQRSAKLAATTGRNDYADFTLHVPLALGQEFYRASSLHRQFAVIASLENNEFNGLKIDGQRHQLMAAGGQVLREYPEPFIFRVTLSFLPIAIDNGAPLPPSCGNEQNLLNHPRFVLRSNQGLIETHFAPTQIRDIGAPSSDDYPERSYEVVFVTPAPLPTDRRVALDVFAPSGFRLAKFYLPAL